MRNSIRVTIIQSSLFWEDVKANLLLFDSKIKSISSKTDIIVLPEMFTTGFTMNPKTLAEEHEGKGLQWMIEKAKEVESVIVGSISVKEKNNYYNRLYWVKPDGSFEYYDKRHLFRMGNEHEQYQAGEKQLIVEYKGWKICPLICYDVRFPVWSRNTKSNPYDILLYVANWPAVRSTQWSALLVSRAIENQCYLVGVNRVGKDGNGIEHSGNSVVLNAKGETMSTITPNQEGDETIELSFDELSMFRKAFPVLLDADSFEIKN